MKKILLALIIILFSVVSAFCSEFEDTLKKAEQGNDKAQYSLGLMYAKGQGVAQDYKQATYWFTKAAELGGVAAQYILGLMYANGHGVAQDYKQAFYWYIKAAGQGHVDAQAGLGAKYFLGQGVPQNYKFSYVWSNLAAAQGHESIVKIRDLVAENLTPQQLAEAQDLTAQIQYKIDHPTESQ